MYFEVGVCVCLDFRVFFVLQGKLWNWMGTPNCSLSQVRVMRWFRNNIYTFFLSLLIFCFSNQFNLFKKRCENKVGKMGNVSGPFRISRFWKTKTPVIKKANIACESEYSNRISKGDIPLCWVWFSVQHYRAFSWAMFLVPKLLWENTR